MTTYTNSDGDIYEHRMIKSSFEWRKQWLKDQQEALEADIKQKQKELDSLSIKDAPKMITDWIKR